MKLPKYIILCCLAAAAQLAHADLVGTSVTGSMNIAGGSTNYFNSAIGYVPAGYGNSGGSTTVTIGSGTEFGFHDNSNTDTANFTGNSVTLTDVTVGSSVGIDYYFTDPSFTYASLISGNSVFSFSLTGTTLHISSADITSSGTRSIQLALGSTAVTPEPSSLALLGTGLIGALAIARRRLFA